MITVLSLFGTRPEAIKFAPVIKVLEAWKSTFRTVNVVSSQHTDLLHPFVRLFGLRVDYDLNVMAPGQHPSQVMARILESLDPILRRENPDLVLVQGDTTTALAGAVASFHRKIPVGHIEAGLRSGDLYSPFPEEMNRQLISRLATLHFAATEHNVRSLINEGIPAEQITLTGNPVVDALLQVLRSTSPSPELKARLERHRGRRLLVLTTHRRESFGETMLGNLRVLRHFVEHHEDVVLFFPVHPNPSVRTATRSILEGVQRVELLEPLDYSSFLHLLAHAWLVVSDSGGVQEEAPTLGKPLLVLRANTERPEGIWAGVAKLVGGSPERLRELLEEASADGSWIRNVREIPNPFGRGNAGEKIIEAIAQFFAISQKQRAAL